ncbi:putative meiosis specific protein Hop1 [Aspergillus lucknowensis]|uniref:HORMA domain-containing protein n=1 Tax=Aspergillus lucknowensis TaxID=176173 RepID=A0ABR4LZA5_9EURO
MVRVKFTASSPVTAIQSQPAQVRGDRPINGTTSAATGIGTTANGRSMSGPEEIQLLQQQQSLEMVKIMLHVTAISFVYLREFLPLPCFDSRDLKEAQRQRRFSYQEFLDKDSSCQGISDSTFGTGKRGQPLKVILRGSDPKADMIVDVLETGIFDALSKSVLEAVQLTIVADKEAPENVLESYTFSFKYTGKLGELNTRLESLSIEPFGYVTDVKSAQTARIGLESIVRRLITLSAFLPTLPNKRTLGIYLFYTEDCPPDYEPPGFSGARDGTINYPLTENWRRESQTCGVMDSGWHTVGLKVTSLKWTGPEPEVSESLPQIPLEIEYKDAVPRTQDIGFESEGRRVDSLQTAESSQAVQEVTQDALERERLKSMMPSQEIQPSDSDLIPTQPAKSMLASEPEHTENSGLNQRFKLSKRKAAEIRKRLNPQHSDAFENPTSRGPGAVHCQCDWAGADERMVECNFCRTRQHLLCYGYGDAPEHAAPDVHYCYPCLLGPDESHILHDLKNIVLARRALRIILDEGYPSRISIFSEKLHTTGPTVERITSFLVKEGFLRPTPGYKARGFMLKGLPKFTVPESEEIRQRIWQEIMDPRMKIGHHFARQELPDSLEALSPQSSSEVDSLNKLDSRNGMVRMKKKDADELGTQTSSDRSMDIPQQMHSLRRRTGRSNPQSVAGDADRNDAAISTPQSTNNGTLQTARKRTRSSQIGPEPVRTTPSRLTPDYEGAGEAVRRSGRKRRKISNYSKLIDVGAETSGSEKV